MQVSQCIGLLLEREVMAHTPTIGQVPTACLVPATVCQKYIHPRAPNLRRFNLCPADRSLLFSVRLRSCTRPNSNLNSHSNHSSLNSRRFLRFRYHVPPINLAL